LSLFCPAFLGAIGIARCFAYAGSKRQPLYDPDVPTRSLASKDHYLSTSNKLGGGEVTEPAFNHFYEKLLTLKDRMRTKTGRRTAESRHQYMVDFLHRFEAECAGTL